MAIEAAVFLGDLEVHLESNAFDALESTVETFAGLVREGVVRPTEAEGEKALKALRRKRQFGALILLAKAFEQAGCASASARCLHAQALIDTVRKSAGVEPYDEIVALLEPVVASTGAEDVSHKEALGLIGRARKQQYIDLASRPPTAADAEVLRMAISAYAKVVERGDFARDHWHLINFVALTARAERDGIHPGHDVDARTLAAVVVDVLAPRTTSDKPDLWELASLGEAYLALGRIDEATATYERYALQAGGNAFELFSSMRQLVEVWEVQRAAPAGAIVAMLEGRLAGLLPKQSALAGADLRRMERLDMALRGDEANFGPGGEAPERARAEAAEAGSMAASLPPSFSLVLKNVKRATSVVRIKDRHNSRHMGTGFLVLGEQLAPELGTGIFLLTNSHVMGRLTGARLLPRRAEIELVDIHERVVSLTLRDDDVVWESPVNRLDATVVRMRDVPDGFSALSLVHPDDFPDDWDRLHEADRECHIVGFLGDLQLSVGFDPYPLIDVGWRDAGDTDCVFIHHDAPTRDGSSGSPLFNRAWEVIALHRAGTEVNARLPALGGRVGDRIAKVAVSINAIRRGIARELRNATSAPPPEPFIQDQELLSLLKDERADEERLAQLVEWDLDRSEPWSPVLKRRPSGDGTVPQGPMSDAWWQLAATTASVGFQARRNYGFKPKRNQKEGLTFVSDGDSWFQFPVPGTADVIDHLRKRHSIYCHAIAGSQLAQQVAQAHERILPSIRKQQPDGVLLSGGGNDLLSFGAINLFVDHAKSGATAASLLKPELETTLTTIVGYYTTWIEKILATAPTLKIFCHGYDWALPIEGASGRWLYQPLSKGRDIKDVTLQRQLVRLIIDRFNERMRGLEEKFPGALYFVDCRGAVGVKPDAWFDELHPRSDGFGKVAARFERRITSAFDAKEKPQAA